MQLGYFSTFTLLFAAEHFQSMMCYSALLLHWLSGGGAHVWKYTRIRKMSFFSSFAELRDELDT